MNTQSDFEELLKLLEENKNPELYVDDMVRLPFLSLVKKI